jgi:uncharacterized Zn finger protein
MSRPRYSFGQQPGRLVATMLRALAAELSDPGRYARAKAYARDGAVIEIDVQPEVVSGLVLGSRRDPYEVLLAVDPVPEHELAGANPDSVGFMTMLIPGREELAVSCTCPDADGGQLCKHALALLLVAADEVSIEPELLIRWRTGSPDDDHRRDAFRLAPRGRSIAERVHDELAARRPAHPSRSAPPAPPVQRVDPLAGMLDTPGPLPAVPRLPPLAIPPPPAVALNDPSVRLLHELTVSALDTVTRRG